MPENVPPLALGPEDRRKRTMETLCLWPLALAQRQRAGGQEVLQPVQQRQLVAQAQFDVDALDPAIDIWCAGPQGFDVARAARERARGRQFWVYNGGRPAGGSIVIDTPATDARALIWAAFKHDVPVYFYWRRAAGGRGATPDRISHG